MATKEVNSKMKDINENIKDYQSTPPFPKDETAQSRSETASAKGDYIDFEEIK